jgi:hypothetical protein
MEAVSGDTMVIYHRRCDVTLDGAFFDAGKLSPQINENDPNRSLECTVGNLDDLVQILVSRRETTQPTPYRILSIVP